MDTHDLTDTAERLSHTLSPGDLDSTLQRITSAAVDLLPGVDYASISVRHRDGRVESFAPTNPLVERLDATQFALREGPCFEAVVQGGHVLAPDVAADARFTRYAEVAASSGVRAQAGLRLFDSGQATGALNLYSTTAGRFADFDELSSLFTQRSSEAIDQARELQAVDDAVKAHRLVGRAVGIAMERYGFTEHRAFAFLTRLAQHHQADLPAVATAVVKASSDRAD